MPRTTAPSTNPRILSGYAPYADHLRSKGLSSTTEGRRQLLLDDPHAQDVQPEQVTCRRCARTVRLQKGKNYHLAHWLDHRWRCDRKVPAAPPHRARCMALLERKAFLEADEDARVVEPDRVVCRRCNREVRLRKGRAYALSCWNQHKAICRMPAYLSAPSGSESVSHSVPHSGTETHKYKPLSSDLPVASTEPQYIKCALCLVWINIRHPKDMDVHVWNQHRILCVAENLTDDKLGWTHPRFFRPLLHCFASGSEVIDTPRVYDSSDSDKHPSFERIASRSNTTEKIQDQTPTGKIPPIICGSENESSPSPSLSPPPSLSSSIPTSSNNSVASTPLPSPRRVHSLFPNSRHLPLPEHSLSRAWTSLEKHTRDEHEVNFCALELRLSPLRSVSPASDRSLRPPPFLERTSLTLPIPKGYWRFESVD